MTSRLRVNRKTGLLYAILFMILLVQSWLSDAESVNDKRSEVKAVQHVEHKL